jgi:hypothetical protein
MAWNANKDKLKAYFQTHKTNDYGHYKDLVKLLFEYVVNPYLEENEKRVYDLEKIHEIDDGDYQGSLLYVIPLSTYQPSCYDYLVTYLEYGSCPFCDLLEGLLSLSKGEIPDEDQVSDFMTLCLHLLQRCKIPYSYED